MNGAEILQIGWHAWLTIGVVLASFLVLAFSRLPADFVFMGGLGVLILGGALSPREALAGFASEGMITVGLLYVASATTCASAFRWDSCLA